jgi:hypothetical protein
MCKYTANETNAVPRHAAQALQKFFFSFMLPEKAIRLVQQQAWDRNKIADKSRRWSNL